MATKRIGEGMHTLQGGCYNTFMTADASNTKGESQLLELKPALTSHFHGASRVSLVSLGITSYLRSQATLQLMLVAIRTLVYKLVGVSLIHRHDTSWIQIHTLPI